MKIPENLIPVTYQESKKVFENSLPIKQAAENINKKTGITINSCADYAYYFRYLMTGEGSCRSLSALTQKYYLLRIHEDYGKEQFIKSLNAFYDLIIKFEKQSNTTKKSMRKIFDELIMLK